ncbi:hypothetical protein EGW08_015540 [Elysia chlorotica]|uniref:Uncharacterized protein n=1 Tax=Elysia chlorotica TaxID=188477 RepID=A0A433T550_ELYCH|nr:hypothetical protein EGW08_015540 [Elysia chlorotica]
MSYNSDYFLLYKGLIIVQPSHPCPLHVFACLFLSYSFKTLARIYDQNCMKTHIVECQCRNSSETEGKYLVVQPKECYKAGSENNINGIKCLWCGKSYTLDLLTSVVFFFDQLFVLEKASAFLFFLKL